MSASSHDSHDTVDVQFFQRVFILLLFAAIAAGAGAVVGLLAGP